MGILASDTIIRLSDISHRNLGLLARAKQLGCGFRLENLVIIRRPGLLCKELSISCVIRNFLSEFVAWQTKCHQSNKCKKDMIEF
jgi:hypothetical protein